MLTYTLNIIRAQQNNNRDALVYGNCDDCGIALTRLDMDRDWCSVCEGCARIRQQETNEFDDKILAQEREEMEGMTYSDWLDLKYGRGTHEYPTGGMYQ